MEWSDDAIIIGVKAHGETSLIAEVMTRAHGRHLGLVRGGRSRTKAASLQPGNLVRARWYARLEEHLGQFTIDPIDLRAGHIMETGFGVAGLKSLSAVTRLLPERDPHEALYEGLRVALDYLAADPDAENHRAGFTSDHLSCEDRSLIVAALVVRFELAILDALGFGLDLARCAATGASDDLSYVSPKSARAVCRTAGQPYQHKLLPLPAFLQGERGAPPNAGDILAGFRLTHYFLDRHVYAPRGLEPDPARDSLIRTLTR